MGAGKSSGPRTANVHYPIVENFVNAVLDGSPLASPGEDAILTDWVTSFVPAAAAQSLPYLYNCVFPVGLGWMG